MIFGIKTKKDKRIEELEDMLFNIQYRDRLHAVSDERGVQKMRARVVLDMNEPVEYAKLRMARQFAEMIEPYIRYDVEDYKDEYGKRILTGTFHVAIDKGSDRE